MGAKKWMFRKFENYVFKKYGLQFQNDFFKNINKSYKMHYDAASTDRTRSDWGITTGVPYEDIKRDLENLIARSRQSADNNGLSENIDNTFMSNVVHSGIIPQAQVRDESGELVESVNNTLNEGWKRYVEQYDRSGKQDYYQMQATKLKTIINSGSILRNTITAKKGSFLPFSSQIIEPDRLDFSKDRAITSREQCQNVSQTQFGIDLDMYGVPIRFHIKGINDPISASHMDIRYLRKRFEQNIGVPWKAPVLKQLWDLDNVIEDNSIASRVRAMIALWVHKDDAPSIIKNSLQNGTVKWDPMSIMYTNQKPQTIETQDKVSDVFDPFTRLLQRNIAIGVGLSYQLTTKDLQGMNFASSRANIMEDRKFFRLVQSFFIKEDSQPDWNMFVEQMFLSGKIDGLSMADFNRDRFMWTRAKWKTPGWGWVDPAKDAKANIELFKYRMTTLEKIYSEKGEDWQDQVEQWANEQKFIKEKLESAGIEYRMLPDDEFVSDNNDQEGEIQSTIDDISNRLMEVEDRSTF